MAQLDSHQPSKTFRGTWDEILSHSSEIPKASEVELRVFEPELPSDNDASIALLESWIAEAPTDPDAIREAEEDLREFKRNMNLPSKETGARLHYPPSFPILSSHITDLFRCPDRFGKKGNKLFCTNTVVMQVSYNKLKTFNECALKYRFSYIERLPRPPIAALAFQRRLHSALANYHFLAKRDGIVREEELLRAYGESFDVVRYPEVKETRSYQEGEGILRRYCENENQKERIPVYLEHTIQVPFGPYVVTGKVDRIDFAEGDRYSIIDYKLDRRLPHGNAAETSDQLSFYALLVSEGLGMQIQDMRLYYLRHGIEQISVPSKRRTRETIEWIDQTANAIHKEKIWSPCAGAACVTCAFHSSCPAKTGQARPHQDVWQQGNLLWDMNGEKDAGAELSTASETGRQMSIEDYL